MTGGTGQLTGQRVSTRVDMSPIAAEPEWAEVWDFTDRVPPGLAAPWTEADSEAVIARDFLRSLTNSAGVVLAVLSLASLALGDEARAGAIPSLIAAASILALRRFADRAARRRGGHFSAAEVDLLLEHRRAVSFADWGTLSDDQLPVEARLARLAAGQARLLVCLPSWPSEEFAPFRLQRHPVEEARQLQISARRVFDERRALEQERATHPTPLAEKLEGRLEEWAHRIDVLWVSTVDRSTAFTGYVEVLTGFAARLEQHHAAQRIDDVLDRTTSNLITNSVIHEMAAADLRLLTGEVGEMLLPNSNAHTANR